MNKAMILVPGMSGKFDSEIFNYLENDAVFKRFTTFRFIFSGYKKNNLLETTFNDQIEELGDLIHKLKQEFSEVIVVAKSVGTISALFAYPDCKKVLISPVITLGEEKENYFSTKLKHLPTRPVMIPETYFLNLKKEMAIVYGDSDNRIDCESISKLDKLSDFIILKQINGGNHDLEGDEVRTSLEEVFVNI